MDEGTSEVMRDTKDWTWVLERPCEQCGFDAAGVARHQIGARLRAGMPTWHRLLSGPTATRRPDPSTWSPLEYACHVRDVHIVFSARVAMVLGQHDPEFANWDQDETAESQAYAEQDPATVARELAEETERVAAAYDVLDPTDEALWARPARRSNGSVFTLDSLARYHLHDVEHHVWDVRPAGA